MTKKDQSIIDANPGIVPYELLMEKGLSQKGYNELVAEHDKKNADLIKSKPPVMVIKPEVSEHIPIQNKSGVVTLVHTSGRAKQMTKFAAERWAKKHPGQYKVV